jgi:hypothetical protein
MPKMSTNVRGARLELGSAKRYNAARCDIGLAAVADAISFLTN